VENSNLALVHMLNPAKINEILLGNIDDAHRGKGVRGKT
jgi:hypothetical protein